MSANDRQVAGSHYQTPIQPWDFIAANGLDFFQGTILKYLCRWKQKGGVEDLRKAHHYLEKYIEVQAIPPEGVPEGNTRTTISATSAEPRQPRLHESHWFDGGACKRCWCTALDKEAIAPCNPKSMEPCCECGESYPAKDLKEDGNIYCEYCRVMEMHKDHLFNGRFCQVCGCKATSTDSYRPCRDNWQSMETQGEQVAADNQPDGGDEKNPPAGQSTGGS